MWAKLFFATSLLWVVSPAALVADTPEVRFSDGGNEESEVTIAYLDHAAWDCPEPFRPARLTSTQWPTASSVDERFLRNARAEARAVVVRRGIGLAEPKEPRSLRQSGMNEDNKLPVSVMLTLVLDLCEHAGFLDVSSMTYTFSGDIGDMSVDFTKQVMQSTGTNLQITYLGPRWDVETATFQPARWAYRGALGYMQISLVETIPDLIMQVDGTLLDGKLVLSHLGVLVPETSGQ